MKKKKFPGLRLVLPGLLMLAWLLTAAFGQDATPLPSPSLPAGPQPTATITPLQATPQPTTTITPLPSASPSPTQPQTTNTITPTPTPTP